MVAESAFQEAIQVQEGFLETHKHMERKGPCSKKESIQKRDQVQYCTIQSKLR